MDRRIYTAVIDEKQIHPRGGEGTVKKELTEKHRLNIADIITLFRIAGTLSLIFLRPFSAGFFSVYALTGLTDVLDGWIARKTETASAFGARLDSIADLLFYAVAQFKLMFPGNHTIITVPESPMFNAPEAAVVTVPRLELVREAGRQYATNGTIDTGLLGQIGSPMIPEEIYAKIVNGQA